MIFCNLANLPHKKCELNIEQGTPLLSGMMACPTCIFRLKQCTRQRQKHHKLARHPNITCKKTYIFTTAPRTNPSPTNPSFNLFTKYGPTNPPNYQALLEVSGHSENFPECTQSFQTVQKVS